MICYLFGYILIFFLKLYGCVVPNLYPINGSVLIFDNQTFFNDINNKSYSIVVNFYASWCGHCKNFAPSLITYAENIERWGRVLKIGAIDCALYNDICVEYDIVTFPTLKFFPPSSNKSLFYNMDVYHNYSGLVQETLKNFDYIINRPINWPNYQIVDIKNISYDKKFSHLLIISKLSNDTIGLQTIFNFMDFPEIKIYRARSTDIDFFDQKYSLQLFKRGVNEWNLIYNQINLTTSNDDLEIIHTIILEFHLNVDVAVFKIKVSEREKAYQISKLIDNHIHSEIHNVIFAKYLKHVYVEDLESTLYNFFFHELLRYPMFNLTQLVTLNYFCNNLLRYLPGIFTTTNFSPTSLTRTGEFFTEFSQWLQDVTRNMRPHDMILKDDIIVLIKTKKLDSYFQYQDQYVGCKGSAPLLRGYPCGLWTLFHTLTVGCYLKLGQEHSNIPTLMSEPYSLLVSIREFVRHFFSCGECAQNFVKAASKITSPYYAALPVPTDHEVVGNMNVIKGPETAALWLWDMHNHVNERLSRDISEDPLFPKIAYPPSILCPECLVTHAITDQEKLVLGNKSSEEYIYWDRQRVLKYLVEHYGPSNIISLSGPDVHKRVLKEKFEAAGKGLVGRDHQMNGIFNNGPLNENSIEKSVLDNGRRVTRLFEESLAHSNRKNGILNTVLFERGLELGDLKKNVPFHPLGKQHPQMLGPVEFGKRDSRHHLSLGSVSTPLHSSHNGVTLDKDNLLVCGLVWFISFITCAVLLLYLCRCSRTFPISRFLNFNLLTGGASYHHPNSEYNINYKVYNQNHYGSYPILSPTRFLPFLLFQMKAMTQRFFQSFMIPAKRRFLRNNHNYKSHF